jgi:hypothetical protein
MLRGMRFAGLRRVEPGSTGAPPADIGQAHGLPRPLHCGPFVRVQQVAIAGRGRGCRRTRQRSGHGPLPAARRCRLPLQGECLGGGGGGRRLAQGRRWWRCAAARAWQQTRHFIGRHAALHCGRAGAGPAPRRRERCAAHQAGTAAAPGFGPAACGRFRSAAAARCASSTAAARAPAGGI